MFLELVSADYSWYSRLRKIHIKGRQTLQRAREDGSETV